MKIPMPQIRPATTGEKIGLVIAILLPFLLVGAPSIAALIIIGGPILYVLITMLNLR